MNDGGLQACSPRAGKSGHFFPRSFKAIIRSASSLASTVRSAGSSVVSTITSNDKDRQCEQLQWAGFDRIELGQTNVRRVLLLTYPNGFQVWDVEDADDVWELVSKRDGPVAFLRVQPQPFPETSDGSLKASRPLLLVVTTDATPCRGNVVQGGLANGYGAAVGGPITPGENDFVPTLVKFYSLRSHAYVHTLRFRTAIYAVRCSSRVVAVALIAQLYCFDAATLQSTFSVLTYPSPQPALNCLNFGYGAVAVGPRWLAYAANQPLVSNTGRVSPQHLNPSPVVSPSTSPANGSFVTHYAKESSKQIAAGIVTLGDLGYKAISKYYSDGVGSPVPGSPFLKGTSNGHPEHAGTVTVRDFVTKVVIAQFRAHTSPLSALCFDPTGTLLVTASIHGHNINVFRIMPVTNMNGANTGLYDASASHVHLYKLSRGMTNAVIQDIAFSEDSHWLAVSSSRGTNHLFAISPFGGAAKPSANGTDHVFGAMTPWWSNVGPIKSSQQASSLPPPATVNSSVISRIKNGNNGWRGTVMDASATTSSGGRTTSFGAAVAVSFHDGQVYKLEVDGVQNGLKEQLWVLSPSGHLIRYGLRFLADTESYTDSAPSQIATVEALDVRVVVEPLQKWDVCRRPTWVEREEKINNSVTRDICHDASNCASLESCYDNGGSLVDRDDLASGGMHQLFLSNAEVYMHHFRPPIWAKCQISFHIFMDNGISGKDNSGGEVEIEKFDTRVVEVRKRDLVPVLDRFKNYQFDEDLRDDNVTSVKSVPLPQRFYSGMPNGTTGIDIGGLQIQRSFSGSSCGSNGSVYSSSNVNAPLRYPDIPSEETAQPVPTSLQLSQKNHSHPENTTLQDPYFPTLNNGKENSKVYLNGEMHDNQLKTEHAVLTSEGDGERNALFPSTNQITSNANIAANQYLTKVSKSTDSNQLEKSSRGGAPNDDIMLNYADRFGLHEYDAPAEEFESNDGNSKSEDFGGEEEEDHGEDGWEGGIGEPGEDGWEGALFPFAEDC